MKHFVPFNKNGNVELSEKELKDMLSDAYREGYVKGQIDHILNTAPDFAINEERESEKMREFTLNGKTLVFRATIL
jgi:hypothetical protein